MVNDKLPAMNAYQPRILEAITASIRMEAICEFIDFWLGPRLESYGEPPSALDHRLLPMPLDRLYRFAGRWPNWDCDGPILAGVPILSHQDCLLSLDHVKTAPDGKVIFLRENQGNWTCRTRADSDDPPVWRNDFDDDNSSGDELVCDSLSRFLATFVLQEITLASRLCMSDTAVVKHLQSDWQSTIPVWINGPYAYENDFRFYLWKDILVSRIWGSMFCAANRQEGIEFLTNHQGPIDAIQILIGPIWTWYLRLDGSAQLRYLKHQTDETVDAPAGTFDFRDLLIRLSRKVSDEGNWEKNALVFFQRLSQSGANSGKHLHDTALIRVLFELTLKKAIIPNLPLARFMATDWPI